MKLRGGGEEVRVEWSGGHEECGEILKGLEDYSRKAGRTWRWRE